MIILEVDALKLKKAVLAFTAVPEEVWFDIFARLKDNGGIIKITKQP